MLYISVLIALVTFFNIIHLLFIKSSNTLHKVTHINFVIKVILTLLFATLIVDRYNHETNYYRGQESCNTPPNLPKLWGGTTQNTYRVMRPVTKYESYNFYIIRKVEFGNTSEQSSRKVEYTEKCNQILKTNSYVIYNVGDIINVQGVAKEANTDYKNNKTQSTSVISGEDNKKSFNYDEYIFYKYNANKIFETFNTRSELVQSQNKTEKEDNMKSGMMAGLSINEKILFYKNKLSENYFINHDGEVAELLSGMTLGTDITLSKRLKTNLQDSGLSHIAVMSGYNVILMSFIIFAIFKLINYILTGIAIRLSFMKLLYIERLEVRTIISLALLAILPIMNNYDAPITRAYIFIFIASLYTIAGRVENYKYIFFITLLIITLYSPHRAIWDVGLHLSALAVGSLIYLEKYTRAILAKLSVLIKSKFFKTKYHNKLEIAKFHNYIEEHIITKYLSVTISAQLLVAPYIAYVFGTWNMLSLVSNLAVGFILPIVTILGILENVFIILHLGIVARVIALPLDIMINYIIHISETL